MTWVAVADASPDTYGLGGELPTDRHRIGVEGGSGVGGRLGEGVSEDLPVLAGFQAGSLVAGYRLEAQVGAGGMAVVFRARDERLGRLVALKLLGPSLAADGAFRRRFIAESRAAAAVDDPHIIPVYEAGEARGVLFIAMRFVKGGDLRLVLEREGALPPGRAAGFISPVASALDAAHGAGLVHRDVKPANILVDARSGRPDHVYLSDFGVSKGAASSVSLTSPGQFLGTPAYSAPEQIQGRTVDGRTDQYALACVAYQLLTGAPPFERDQGMAVLLAHLSEPPPSLSSRQPGLSGAADQVLAKGMAKVPEKRYASCRDFADALREALDLAPYHSASFDPAPDRPHAQAATPQVQAATPPAWFSRPGAAGPAAAPDPLAAATIDSPLAGFAGHAAGQPDATPGPAGATGTLTGAPGEPSPSAVEDGPAGAENVITADPARGISAEPASHRALPERRGRFHFAWPRRRWPVVTASLVVLLAVVVVGGFIAWRWTQGQYYVGADSNGQVVIYRGVNQRIAGISLSSPYELTGIQLAQVPAPYQQTVKATDPASSLSNAQAIVSNVRTAVGACQQQYTAVRDWVKKDDAYLAAVAQARQERKSTANLAAPGPQPSRPSAACPASASFGIPASALIPAR